MDDCGNILSMNNVKVYYTIIQYITINTQVKSPQVHVLSFGIAGNPQNIMSSDDN